MTAKKDPTNKKPKKAAPAPRQQRAGFLSCERCTTVAPFQGNADNPSAWPQHRCGFDIRPFTRWSKEDPNRLPLPKQPGPLERDDDASTHPHSE